MHRFGIITVPGHSLTLMDNDNLIPLRVMGLSYNQLQNGAYALLLAQEDGPYRIPVVIGARKPSR